MQVVEMFREGCMMEAIAHARFGSQVEKDYICEQLGIEPYMLGWYGGVAMKSFKLLGLEVIPDFRTYPDLVLHHYVNQRAEKALYHLREVEGEGPYEAAWTLISARKSWLSGGLSAEDYGALYLEHHWNLNLEFFPSLGTNDAEGRAHAVSKAEMVLLRRYSAEVVKTFLPRREEGALRRDQCLTLYRLCYRFATGGLKP